jgi:hypothetical protein
MLKDKKYVGKVSSALVKFECKLLETPRTESISWWLYVLFLVFSQTKSGLNSKEVMLPPLAPNPNPLRRTAFIATRPSGTANVVAMIAP